MKRSMSRPRGVMRKGGGHRVRNKLSSDQRAARKAALRRDAEKETK